ncbi:hypothetical protein CDL12_20453 [Handroanthus impetiginosus]|uniref:Uncharacterized protein n=1 Tax=Handroanthus impetiginosus TaxID=429701 RepID=A0A2G9GNV7_9LAMI|nr:hypothetical protein CDL12_20453 [Handroanthus impetiginosus]
MTLKIIRKRSVGRGNPSKLFQVIFLLFSWVFKSGFSYRFLCHVFYLVLVIFFRGGSETRKFGERGILIIKC